MTTLRRLEETVERYAMRQERSASIGATYRSERGGDARALLRLVKAVQAMCGPNEVSDDYEEVEAALAAVTKEAP
jgi:hypothetical protein